MTTIKKITMPLSKDLLDSLTNEIEQGFMQKDGWKTCRYMIGVLVENYNVEIKRLKTEIADKEINNGE